MNKVILIVIVLVILLEFDWFYFEEILIKTNKYFLKRKCSLFLHYIA